MAAPSLRIPKDSAIKCKARHVNMKPTKSLAFLICMPTNDLFSSANWTFQNCFVFAVYKHSNWPGTKIPQKRPGRLAFTERFMVASITSITPFSGSPLIVPLASWFVVQCGSNPFLALSGKTTDMDSSSTLTIALDAFVFCLYGPLACSSRPRLPLHCLATLNRASQP
eukprot:TRINITY_DN517_c0_g4_i3.p1 TRINITY_DN517_c0_g4~~TRINITY_DN517_c0_g4_i3.p1  ORF type:complete len:168 (+),score=1.28 TRINITY_DN517_c0_g4_i3:67-570(+)